jgi:phosphoenolpyruvate carboxykinase (ATP)
MWQWWNGILSGEIQLRVNTPIAKLVEKAIQGRSGTLSSSGALVVESGKFTGRAPEDKYVVRNEASEDIIDWDGKILSMDDAKFNELKTEYLKKVHMLKPETFIIESSAGADPSYSIGVNLITPSPVHALFCRQIMRPRKEKNPLGTFTIYHDPKLEFDADKYKLRSSTVIALNFASKEILITGTAYCGEIKKAIFSVMNTLLPDLGILPMHSGACSDAKGNVSVFFGLSGTGKTTLSTDEGMSVIGDDEHGLSERGIFNFEGGCYAKTYKLKESDEPQIYRATNRFGSLMENVMLDHETRMPDFDDKSITENGRSTYPLTALETIINDGRGSVPTNFFFLSADAMGVLPAISKLDLDQAMYYFLLGYTAKVAGTEMNMKGISATFSHCFGAPFMLRRPEDYGNILKDLLKKHDIKVWLVNTGWSGGPYGVGSRYPLSLTRSCIRAVQQRQADTVTFTKDKVFGLDIPDSLGSIESSLFRPEKLWANEKDYFDSAKKLKSMFDENFEKITRSKPHVVSHKEDLGLHRSE